MKQITADFESYYDPTYSLTKMQTDAYVLSDLYQTMGVAVKVDDGVTHWFTGTEEETSDFLHEFDWKNSAVMCHHTLFDGFIFAQRFGIKPKLWMDTKSMATVLYPYLRSYSLANLAKTFGLQDKGDAVVTMIGRRRESMNPIEAHDYGEYCINDVEITYLLGKKMLPYMPALELRLIDMTVRMFTEPVFVGDVPLLEKLYADEQARKIAIMALAGTDKETIMSNDKFAKALEQLGVVPPKKLSAKTGKESWAFAKTDEAFTALLEHEDSDVQALVAARLGVKTTIAETRALKMLETARRGKLPVYLNYWGAKTTGRYSGGNYINWQNLPARGPSAGMRRAIGVSPGHVMVVGDSSNIELRVAMAASMQDDLIALILAGEDLYCNFATKMFGRIITKADKKERLLGKIAMLSLQYGAGWRKFKEMVRQQSGDVLSDENAEGIVNLYRRVHHKVVDMWARFDNVILPEIFNGNQNLITVEEHAWCLCTGLGYGVAGGPGVAYLDLRRESVTDKYGRPGEQWVYTMGSKTVKLYGGKAFENYCQHVARQIVMWQTARINHRYPVALSVHDEAVCVVREEERDACVAYMTECLNMAPPWCAGTIPLACEVHSGYNYEEAK
jgi:DNA polymerase